MKSAHLKGGKGQRPNPNKMDGKKTESDQYFMYNMAILVGSPCEITIRDGRKYDGVFAAYAADRHEILIEAAHRINEDGDDEAPITEHYDVLVIPTDKMLSTRFKSVDVNYATRDFTDQAIVSGRGLANRDKELTPWDGPDVGSDEDLSLDGNLATTKVKENGWEAKDMFKKNEEKYGVTSSYSNDLSGYTTQLDKSDPDAYKRAEQQANQIAQEIEKTTATWERGELENGEDEEEAFSAVVRPRNSAGHSNLNNNNNNNNSSGGSGTDKYIPPSRRQGNIQPNTQSLPQPQQNLPMNNNGASQMNNNGGNPRKQMYGQNQNPRGNYGVPPNNLYHDRRSNYDPRGRGPPPNQYNNPNSHNEVRRMDDGRPQRMPNKPAMDRRGGGGGRDDPSKLKEFSTNFRLQASAEQNQNRRMPNNGPQQQQHTSANINSMVSSVTSNSGPTGPSRNISPPSAQQSRIPGKEETITTTASTPTANTDTAQEKGNIDLGGSGSSSSSSVTTQSINEISPTSGGSTYDNQTPSSVDSKNSDANKKKFTFNPDAKEFNPLAKPFTSRSPSTPPRPPSTPAQPTTPQQQMMQQQQIHSYMPMPIQMVYAQPYPQTAALTPSSNSSVSSAGNTPRHGGHRKGGAGMLGGPPRSDMTPPIQMTAGPPILTPASMQAGGAPAQYAFVPQGHYSQVMRVGVVPQSVMPVFPTEGGGSSQMHQQVHYIHNGAPNQNTGGHPNNNTPPNNPNAPTSVVSANGQGYQSGGNHGHVGYPFVGVPVMNVGYPHGPPHMITVPYVSHSHQGGTTVLPQSQ